MALEQELIKRGLARFVGGDRVDRGEVRTGVVAAVPLLAEPGFLQMAEHHLLQVLTAVAAALDEGADQFVDLDRRLLADPFLLERLAGVGRQIDQVQVERGN